MTPFLRLPLWELMPPLSPHLPTPLPSTGHQCIGQVQKQTGSSAHLTSQAQKHQACVPWARMFHCMTLIGGWLPGQSVLRSTKSLWERGGRVCRTALHSSRSSLGSMGSRCPGSGGTKYSGCWEAALLFSVLARALYSLLVPFPMEHAIGKVKKVVTYSAPPLFRFYPAQLEDKAFTVHRNQELNLGQCCHVLR